MRYYVTNRAGDGVLRDIEGERIYVDLGEGREYLEAVIVDIPDTVEAFRGFLNKHGRADIFRPNPNPDWRMRDITHPDLWSICFNDDYD